MIITRQAIYCLFLFFLLVFVFAPLCSVAVPEDLLNLWQAHERWETAFENADIKAAESVWSHEEDVIGIDPMGFKAVGFQDVRKNLSWGFAFLGPSQMVTWDVVVSLSGDKGSVTGKYILLGAFLNQSFNATELYRKEYGQWRLYYDDGLGNKPPLFPEDEASIRRLVAQVTHSFLYFDLPTLEALFASSHRYLNYDNQSFCGREASITALKEEQPSITLLQFEDIIIFLFREASTLTAEVTFQLRYDAKGETKNTYGNFLFDKQEEWKLVLTNLFGHTEKQNPPQDLNCDGIVDLSDLVLVGQHLGEENPLKNRADVNGDGVVDISDLVLIGRHLGDNY
jgi:ketosteroid isomerase-like protein